MYFNLEIPFNLERTFRRKFYNLIFDFKMPSASKVMCKNDCGNYSRLNRLTKKYEDLCSGCIRKMENEKVRVEELKVKERRRKLEKEFKNEFKRGLIIKEESEIDKIEEKLMEMKIRNDEADSKILSKRMETGRISKPNNSDKQSKPASHGKEK